MANDLLSTGISGLTAYQRSLAVAGHNITNVNTEGYNRQSVDLVTREPSSLGVGFVGNGVEVSGVRRVYDQFLSNEATLRRSTYNQADALYTMASRVDGVLASEASSLSPAIQAFFNAVHDVANNPTSAPARQVLLTEAGTLTNRFAALDNEFGRLRDSVNAQVDVMASDISGIAANIAELNRDIVVAGTNPSDQLPNDLLDKRDQQVARLAELVSVRTVEVDDGSINVFIGNGQSLVLGFDAASLQSSTGEFDPGDHSITFVGSTASFDITAQLNGGRLGGLLDFRRNVLDPAQDGLGRIAVALSDSFNTQHRLGDDLNGNPGGDFFAPIAGSTPTVFSSTRNNPASGTLGVTIDDSTRLQASDYRLDYDGSNFSLLRLADNTVVDSGFTVGDFPRTLSAEGVTLSLSGSVAAGDSFLVRPVRNGARDMAVAITDGSAFAAAASGNAAGDNGNALALAAQQTQKLMGGGTETYQSAYAKVLADAGVKTREAETNSKAQQALLNHAEEAVSEVSGVNLDEEAANLLRYQQAYAAAAQVVKAADTLFQTLLSVTAR